MKNIMFKIIIVIMALSILNLFFTTDAYSAERQKRAPDFTIEEIGGEEIVLSDLLKDRKVVLVFWATWCPHCRAEIPYVEKFYKENKDEFAVIGINVGESKTKVSSFMQKTKISYPVALDSDSSISKLYDVVGVPTIVAINKNGETIYVGHSMQEVTDRLQYSEGGKKMGTIRFEEAYQSSTIEEGVRLITYEQFMDIRNSGEEYILLDVLSPESYNNGHIKGAISFPLDTINKENAEKLLLKDSKIIVYCASFTCHASTNAAKKLSGLGYNKVLDYKGGLKEWQEKGNQLHSR